MLFKWDFFQTSHGLDYSNIYHITSSTPLKSLQQMLMWKSVIKGDLTAGNIGEEPIPCEQQAICQFLSGSAVSMFWGSNGIVIFVLSK